MSSTQRIITANNKSPLIQVLALMFCVIAILSCFVRIGTKLYMIKSLRVDDILIIVATILAASQTGIVFNACEHGLGQHFEVLSSSDRETFFKSQYAINTMFIASLLCCKLSGTMGLRIMAQKSQKWVIIACEAVVGAWGFTALLVNLFQCLPPTPWMYGGNDKCINLKAFWAYYSIANIITDLAIVIIMAENVVKIQTSWSKKILVMSVFGSRIFVTPAIAAQIHFTNKAFDSADHSFSIWPASITIQLVQCLAILTVCLPNFKPFLDSLESGQIRVDDLRRQGKTSSNGYPSKKPGYAGYKSKSSKSGQSSRSRVLDQGSKSQRSEIHEMEDFTKKQTHDHERNWDGQSRSSHSSQKILIHQTWQVDVEATADAAARQT
ncbi:integral membrane protein [Fusarium beomiforme]|uniref:Integral membrane protein n=1 Tax=Fusarium beomiforme TaxID=44412 RepID=A0A9P5ASJ0_9HYPO|nr:integral membrane protein [Fusarium beomiforme]